MNRIHYSLERESYMREVSNLPKDNKHLKAICFKLYNDDRWWYITSYVPTEFDRAFGFSTFGIPHFFETYDEANVALSLFNSILLFNSGYYGCHFNVDMDSIKIIDSVYCKDGPCYDVKVNYGDVWHRV